MEANVIRQLSTGSAELLISSMWQGLLLTAFAWTVLKLAPGLRASIRFALWMIVFVLVALLPLLSLAAAWLGHFPAPAGLALASHSVELNRDWALAIDLLWVTASLFALGRVLASALSMPTLLRRSDPVPFASLTGEMQSAVMRPGSPAIEIRLSDQIDTPSVVGFFRPAILVPRPLWSELSSGELRDVILHEKAHLERRDDWTNLLQKLLRALCPLNPALAWAESHLCLEREQACDDAVLDQHANPRAYATCLTKLAERRLVRRAASLAPGLWKRTSELAGRVDNILHRRPAFPPMVTRGLLAGGLLASLFGAVLLQRCPDLVTFTGRTSTVAGMSAPGLEAADRYQPADASAPRSPFTRASFQQGRQNTPRMVPASFTQPAYPRAASAAEVRSPRTRAANRVSLLKRTPHSPAARRTSVPAVRLLEFRADIPDGDTRLTLLLFTFEASPDASPVPSQSLPTSTLVTPQGWILFQI